MSYRNVIVEFMRKVGAIVSLLVFGIISYLKSARQLQRVRAASCTSTLIIQSYFLFQDFSLHNFLPHHMIIMRLFEYGLVDPLVLLS